MGEETCNDELIMPFISSASIACGYHAGNEKTMKETIELCIEYNVAIGAHPSFPDKLNFGRTENGFVLCSYIWFGNRSVDVSIAKIAKAAENKPASCKTTWRFI